MTTGGAPASSGSPGTPRSSAPGEGEPTCAGARRAESERWSRQVSLQRHLHDGPSLRISALVPQLGVLRDRMRDDADAQSSIDGLQDQLSAALQELREVARGIYPPLLDEAGLGPALREVADRLPVAVHLDAPDERFGTAVEGAVYFALTDCLTALAPGAGPVTLTLRRDGDELVVLAGGVPHGAVADLVHRLRPLGGHATAPAEPGGRSPQLPVEVRIPCE